MYLCEKTKFEKVLFVILIIDGIGLFGCALYRIFAKYFSNVPSYLITIYYSNSGNSSGIRYTDHKTKPEIEKVIREKLRKVGLLSQLAIIRVELSTRPAEKDL
jgi:hypothetical protein